MATQDGGSIDTPPSPPDLDQDLEVINTTAGQLSGGDSFAAGTSIEEVLRQMLIKPEKGTVSLSGTNPQLKEMGATFGPTLTASPTQNQSGALQEVRIDGTVVSPSPHELTTSFQIGSAADITASRSFQAEADFAESDDFSAVTASSGTVIYQGRRYIWYGTSNAAPGSSADVRGLSSSILDAKDGKVFQIDVPDGATSVEFAYPKALGAVQKIEFQGALTSDVTSDYSRSTVSVNGAPQDGSYAIDYYVYRREPSSPYSDVTVEITI